MINQNCFAYLLLQIRPAIIQTFNFKFENVSFTKLQKKKKKIIRQATNKVITKLKWRKCSNFFKSLIKGNISLNFLLILIISFYIEVLYSDRAYEKIFSWF